MGAPSPGTRSPAQKQDTSVSSDEQFIICPAAGAARPHAASEWHGAQARAPASGAQGKRAWEPQKKITGEVEGGSSREKTPGRRSQGTALSRARAVSVSWDGWHSRVRAPIPLWGPTGGAHGLTQVVTEHRMPQKPPTHPHSTALAGKPPPPRAEPPGGFTGWGREVAPPA